MSTPRRHPAERLTAGQCCQFPAGTRPSAEAHENEIPPQAVRPKKPNRHGRGRWPEVRDASYWRAYIEAHSEPVTECGCWIWMSSLGGKGYGACPPRCSGEQRAHRLAWRIYRGAIPPKMMVLHRCDVRACVNPDHLWLGTNADNMRDMVAKGRSSRWATRNHKGRVINHENDGAAQALGEQ